MSALDVGRSRPLAEELEVSRRVVDFDLHRVLGRDSGGQPE